jgi:hypothetical protein
MPAWLRHTAVCTRKLGHMLMICKMHFGLLLWIRCKASTMRAVSHSKVHVAASTALAAVSSHEYCSLHARTAYSVFILPVGLLLVTADNSFGL